MTENVNSSQSAQTSTQPAPSASETSRSPLQSNHLAKQSSQSKEKKTVEDESDEILAFTIHIVTPKKQKLTLQVSMLDSVEEIKSFLEQNPESVFITSYHLEFNNKPINEYVQLSEIPGLRDGSILHMVEDPYSERTARLHVQILQEHFLTFATTTTTTESQSLFHDISTEKEPLDSFGLKSDEKTGRSEAQLASFFPKSSQQNIRCLRRLCYSGWNPPPSQRQMMGDLFYLDVGTLEEQSFCVTAWAKGFFINKSHDNVFDPSPAINPCYSHNLADLLAKVSPLFSKNVQAIFAQISERHPFETVSVPIPCFSWLGKPSNSHEYDNSRAELNFMKRVQLDFNIHGQSRDWNEEWQTCRELPRQTIQERIIRDRALYKVHCDFVDAAIEGAMAIISGSVPPLNPMDSPLDRLFIYNNIFFCFAYNGEALKGGNLDKNLYRQVNNELLGVSLLNGLDIPGLHTTLFVIVDYRGYRVVAQSLIPGLFAGIEKQNFDFVRYGSHDGKKRVHDEEFYQLFKQAADLLYLKPHTILDEEGNKFKIVGCSDQKGIRGSDGRWYVLEPIRLTPRDANYPEQRNSTNILRSELITQYLTKQLLFAVEKEISQKKQNQTSETKSTNQGSETTTQQKSTAEGEGSSQTENTTEANGHKPNNKIQGKEGAIPIPVPNISFNVDVFTGCKFGEPDETVKNDELNVKKLADFLKNDVIKTLVEDFERRATVPSDSETLVTVLHSRGINLRYLGYIATLCAQKNKANFAYDLCLREMICRVSKKILNELLMKTESYNLATTIANFLNTFFGKYTPRNMGSKSGLSEYQKQAESRESSLTSTSTEVTQQQPSQLSSLKSGKRKKKGGDDQQQAQQKENQIPSFTHNTLWAQIRKGVKEHFKFELPEEIPEFIFDVVTLRSLCQKCGIKIACRDYNWESETPFTSNDILDLFPKIKHAPFRTLEGYQLLEIGKNYIAQGRYDLAYEFLIESLAVFHQVYGPLSKEAALCYSNLAMICYHGGDIEQSLLHQEKATIIFERVVGLDNYETAHAYGNLGLFYHSSGRTKEGLNFLKRALYLSYLAGGEYHSDNGDTYMNIAMLYQELDNIPKAIECLHKSLKCNEIIYGRQSLHISGCLRALAIAYSKIENFKEALNYEKQNYNILKELFGEGDIRTVESNIYLKQFTANAVKKARIEKIEGAKLSSKHPESERQRRGLTERRKGRSPAAELLSFMGGHSNLSHIRKVLKKTAEENPYKNLPSLVYPIALTQTYPTPIANSNLNNAELLQIDNTNINEKLFEKKKQKKKKNKKKETVIQNDNSNTDTDTNNNNNSNKDNLSTPISNGNTS